ncbi:MAG: hypothetical protein WA947_02485 [Phormidesmis sp.]
MTRRRYSDLLERVPETHYLECPRCHHHSIVSRGEGKYACLHCNWYKNVDDWGDGPPLPLVFMAVGVLLMLLFLGG